ERSHTRLAGQSGHTVDRYRAGAAHADTARAAERKRGILLPLHQEEGVEHRHALFERDFKLLNAVGDSGRGGSRNAKPVGLFTASNRHGHPVGPNQYIIAMWNPDVFG